MMDWITRLPDGALAVLAAGSGWFGFNYAVLAERAMARDLVSVAVPACVADLESLEVARTPVRSGIGGLLGFPELDLLEDRIAKTVAPPILTIAEKTARCACAATLQTASLRFDYAVHTASFRLVPAASAAAFRIDASKLVGAAQCRSLLPS